MPSQMLLGADVRNCLLKCWKCVKSIDSLLERFCRGNVSFHRITNNDDHFRHSANYLNFLIYPGRKRWHLGT